MTLQRTAYAVSAILMVLFMGVFLGNQRLAYAQVDGGELVCVVFDELNGAGSPIPPLNADDCEGQGGEMQMDFCPNLEGIQEAIPEAFELIGGLCQPVPPTCDEGEHLNDDNECVPGEQPVDLCPNIEGVQETIPEGKELNDAGDCVDIETPEEPGDGDGGNDNGGGSPGPTGGGGGGGLVSGGVVLGATTTAASCDTYLTAFIKPGAQNDPEQVTRLQSVLSQFEGMEVGEAGVYDAPTLAAVMAFQGKYASEILAPWGITQPTGFVYLTTRKKMNEIYCANATTFPLSEEEKNIIEAARRTAAAATAATTKTIVEKSVVTPEKETQPSKETTAEQTNREQPAVTTPGSRIGDFFRRLFDRFR